MMTELPVARVQHVARPLLAVYHVIALVVAGRGQVDGFDPLIQHVAILGIKQHGVLVQDRIERIKRGGIDEVPVLHFPWSHHDGGLVSAIEQETRCISAD
jgi:hypothetical protein